jgi:hypothetical protein
MNGQKLVTLTPMTTNYPVPCDPPAAAACDGINFFRDLNGAIVGRCVWCLAGFVVTEANAADVRVNMVTHLNVVHGRGIR